MIGFLSFVSFSSKLSETKERVMGTFALYELVRNTGDNVHFIFIFFLSLFFFNFILFFKLYIIVLVLPNINKLKLGDGFVGLSP